MDIEQLQREHEAMKIVLTLIASGTIQGDNCRAIANTTMNSFGVNHQSTSRESVGEK